MLDTLLKLQEFCERHSDSFPELKVTEEQWLDILHLAEALTPSKITTKMLQSEQLTLGDFYSQWVNCKLKTNKIVTPFAVALFEAMAEREKKLLSNDAFVSAILLDPRYSFSPSSFKNNIENDFKAFILYLIKVQCFANFRRGQARKKLLKAALDIRTKKR